MIFFFRKAKLLLLLFLILRDHRFRIRALTCLKLPLALYSHSSKSKNNGMVALRSSASGIKVISKKGPTMPVKKRNLVTYEKSKGLS